MRFCKPVILLLIIALSAGRAKSQQPPVEEIYKTYDLNSDGLLEANEVAGSRYARQFSRWDVDGDLKVSQKEVIDFRRRFGIAADGSMLRSAAPRVPQQRFLVPDISELVRVEPGVALTREVARNSAFVLGTKGHPTSSSGYLILTDHNDEAFLKSIRKLATHRDGTLLIVPDLSILHQEPVALADLKTKIQDLDPKFVAISPRLESFREKMLLSILEILSSLDDDPEMDVFLGFLLASDAAKFSGLIDQSINHESVAVEELKPIAISQVLTNAETRSLQKAAMLRKHFRNKSIDTPIVAIYGAKADAAPRLPGEKTWNLNAPGGGKFIDSFSPELTSEFVNSNLIIMHGHGIPGMSCSVDIQAVPENLRGKVLMTGSCFSAAPLHSDLPAMREAPGGYNVVQRDSFVLRAIDQGAVVAFGHQRLSSGFPHLYPVLECWLDGKTVGEGYQRLLNGLINLKGYRSGDFAIKEETNRPPQNIMLYVVIGDPALQPFNR